MSRTPRPPKLVLTVIDGMKPTMAERAMRAGSAPALCAIRERGTYVDGCVAAFPSVTPVCAATIATGRLQDEHEIPSMNWYSRAEARARAGDERPRRGAGQRRAQAAAQQPRPPEVEVVGERRREQQRAQADAEPRQRRRERSLGDAATLGDDDRDDGDDDRQQPAGRLEERERRALVVDPDVGGRQRARDERRQERADARRAGESGALEDVDQQSHSVR